MADLFSMLAQEQPSSGVIRPRLHARFEESSFAPAAEFEEQTLTQLPETADQIDHPAEPHEIEDSAARPASPEMPDTATIRETTLAPADERRAEDSHAVNLAEKAQSSAPALAGIESPAGGGQTQEPAPAAQMPPVKPQETAVFAAGVANKIKVDRTTAAPPLRTVEEGLETIRPARNDRGLADVTHRESDQDDAPAFVELFPSPVRPAVTAEELTAPDSADRPAGQPPNIEIHIGRIELRQAAAQMKQVPAARPRFEPPVSLSAYLERRDRGGK